jgi:hypothetical protein
MSKISWKLILVLGVVVLALVISCAVSAKSDDIQEKGYHQEEGEESGEKLSPTETYDQVHKGIRLVLAFHNASSSFMGSVENVTDKKIKSVRVEVHLSDGTELGPTKPMDLSPGEKVGIKLETAGQSFTWWKAHAEVGSGEYGWTI